MKKILFTKPNTAYLSRHTSHIAMILFVALVACTGVYLMQLSSAATTAMPTEVEQGSVLSPAISINDVSASGAKAIKFQRGITYASPITISAGGTYTGNWESTDPLQVAVTIATSEEVILQDCTIRSRSGLIRTSVPHAKVIIRNCAGYAVNPGIAGRSPGRFLASDSFDRITVQNNYLEGTAGIYLLSYKGNHTTDTVKILRNRVKNIDGRHSTGEQFSTTDKSLVQFVQFDKVKDIPDAEIAWNEVINEPFYSRPEDNINIYLSNGIQTAPLLIHDNYIQGAYPALPESQPFSGGGIITDGAANETQWLRVYNNQVVSTSNYGIAIAAGSNNVYYNNRVISSGLLPDGRPIASQNIGAYVWNIKDGPGFADNAIRDNTIAWYKPLTAARNNWWFPDCAGNCTGNQAYKSGQAITLADEAAELAAWNDKITTARVIVGPAL